MLFCTPEYASTLPGSFKNLLDWMVGGTGFTGKPVAWAKVAADARRGEGAHATLTTVLDYVHAKVADSACRHVPIERAMVGPDGLVADPGVREAITRTLQALLHDRDACIRIGTGEATTAELAAHLGITNQTAAQLVEYLVAHKYVERRPDPRDARARLLILTDQGRACAAADSATAETVDLWKDRLSPSTFSYLHSALTALAEPGRLRPTW